MSAFQLRLVMDEFVNHGISLEAHSGTSKQDEPAGERAIVHMDVAEVARPRSRLRIAAILLALAVSIGLSTSHFAPQVISKDSFSFLSLLLP